MLEFFRAQSGALTKIDAYQNGCWINVTSPTQEEIASLHQTLGVPLDFLTYPLDVDERSRFEKDGEFSLIIFQTSAPLEDAYDIPFDTVPVGIIHTKDCVLTVCSSEVPVIKDFIKSGRNISTVKKNRLTLQLFLRNAQRFLSDLRHLNRSIDETQTRLQHSTRNKELLELLRLEKNLVYFMTALKSNEVMMERLRREQLFEMFPDDQDLLNDVIIENLQAIEMTQIANNITSSMTEAFASIISNNVNSVMKILAIATILTAVPTFITSLYGMNVPLPFQGSPLAFIGVIILSLLLISAILFLLWRRRWL
jgi:magnesium transporter